MGKTTTQLKKIFTHSTESIAALMLAVMFVVFLLQIFARYVLGDPYSWTPELCLALWVWIVFFGNAFIVQSRHQVTFDIFFIMSPPTMRRIFSLISSIAIVVGMALAFLPTYEYIDWLKIKKSATLKIPMRGLFAIYLLFMVAVILRYAWQFYYTLRHGVPEENIEYHFGDN